MKNTYNSVQVTIAIVCLLVTLVTGAYQCDILYTIPCKTGGLCYDKYMVSKIYFNTITNSY